jgi:hypothetical protein
MGFEKSFAKSIFWYSFDVKSLKNIFARLLGEINSSGGARGAICCRSPATVWRQFPPDAFLRDETDHGR